MGRWFTSGTMYIWTIRSPAGFHSLLWAGSRVICCSLSPWSSLTNGPERLLICLGSHAVLFSSTFTPTTWALFKAECPWSRGGGWPLVQPSEVGLKPPEGCLWPPDSALYRLSSSALFLSLEGRNRFCINRPGRRDHHTSALGSIPVLKGDFKLHGKLEQVKGMEPFNSDMWACVRFGRKGLHSLMYVCNCRAEQQDGHGRQSEPRHGDHHSLNCFQFSVTPSWGICLLFPGKHKEM